MEEATLSANKKSNGKSLTALSALADVKKSLGIVPLGGPQREIGGDSVTFSEDESLRIRQVSGAINGFLVQLGASAARRMLLDRDEVMAQDQGRMTQDVVAILAKKKAVLEREAGALLEKVLDGEKQREALVREMAKAHGIDMASTKGKVWNLDVDTMTLTSREVPQG